MMALVSTFEYTSINSSLGDIRVLNIHPGDQADELNLTFDVVRILDDSELDFEAMSYRWGSPDGEHPVLLNCRLFNVTSSQNRMLRDLRDTQNTRTVWIDALCINQKDISERNEQIQLLRLVYKCARHVCIYLDHEVDENSPAYRKFLTFTSDCKAEDLLEGGPLFWQQICDALRSEYFTRVWVQQEMSLARRLALQCRMTPMPMICLIYFLEAWHDLGYEEFQGNLEADTEDTLLVHADLGFLNILHGFDTPFTKGPLDFIQLLCRSEGLKCTDDRDRIYGVMFLAQNWRRGYLRANYSLTVSDVFREAMVSYLQNFGSISFLQHTNFSYENYGHVKDRIPSWVPDWRKKPLKLALDSGAPEIERRGNYPLVARVFGVILYTTGIKLTSVQKYYGNLLGHNGVLSTPVKEFWVVFNDIVQNATHPTSLEGRSRRLFWLLVDRGDAYPLGSKVDAYIRGSETFISFFDSMLESAADDPFLSSQELNDLRFLLKDTGTIEGNEEHWLIFRLLNRLTVKQFDLFRPFISEAGSIGLAPPHTQPGEELWLLPTCSHPIVLRPQNGKHIVLGNSWLDNDRIWEPCGGMRDFLTEGDEFGSYKVQPLWLI